MNTIQLSKSTINGYLGICPGNGGFARKRADYLRAYHIGGDKGLLKVMDLDVNPRYGSRIKEQFEEILDTLQQDGIIKGWNYKEKDLEKQIEQERNWFANTWLKARVQIIPPTEITGIGMTDDLLLIEDNDYETENFLTMLKGMTERKICRNHRDG